MKDNYKYVIDNKSSNDVAKKLVIGAGFDNYINFLDLIIYTNKDENIQINNKCEFVCDIIQKMCGEKVILTNNQRNIVKSICLKLYKEYVFKLKLRNKNDDEILYDKELNPTLKDLYNYLKYVPSVEIELLVCMLDVFVYRLDIYNRHTNIVLDKNKVNAFNLDYIPIFLKDVTQDIILEFVKNENMILESKGDVR
jgi:hypothetical protein